MWKISGLKHGLNKTHLGIKHKTIFMIIAVQVYSINVSLLTDEGLVLGEIRLIFGVFMCNHQQQQEIL